MLLSKFSYSFIQLPQNEWFAVWWYYKPKCRWKTVILLYNIWKLINWLKNISICSFSTSRQTLTWIPDTFFTSLLSGRINTLVDNHGSIFIDRDPALFTYVLNYLRTKEINLPETEGGIRGLMHEAEFYGITPLTQQLALCQDLDCSSCGNVLFYGCLNPPSNHPTNILLLKLFSIRQIFSNIVSDKFIVLSY